LRVGEAEAGYGKAGDGNIIKKPLKVAKKGGCKF